MRQKSIIFYVHVVHKNEWNAHAQVISRDVQTALESLGTRLDWMNTSHKFFAN